MNIEIGMTCELLEEHVREDNTRIAVGSQVVVVSRYENYESLFVCEIEQYRFAVPGSSLRSIA